ncbi:MAG TPA: RluA family pseudouridine synthase [Planctomycetota bacterium]|nr:RluA family pseudouridine synthase [Planctomycetota bacterium]
MDRRLELQVDQGDLGQRIDRFVAGRIRSLSRTFVASLVADGRVLVDGEPVRRVAQKLQKPGRVTVVLAPEAHDDEVNLDDRIIHLDDAIVVVNKPAGLPVSARLRLGGEDALKAVRRVLERRGLGCEFLGNPHRLDKDTSGVLVLARTREAARVLSEAFKAGETIKTYLAWTEGLPPTRSGFIAAPILAPGDGEARIDPRGRPARTRYRVVAVSGGRALLSVRLLTGRTHQIRLHLAHLGTPIVGDRVHGRAGGGLLLHARRLVLLHPATGARIVLRAPPPFSTSLV